MRGMADDSIDLIYLDPPFNSKHDYAAPIGTPSGGAEFKDTWTLDDVDIEWWGQIADEYPALYKILEAAKETAGKSMMSYLIYMAVRIIEMHRVLKDTGSLYLHCDPTASHYLKLVMDAVFGNFIADITWRRTFAHNDKMFGAIHDHILYYSKADGCVKNLDAVKIPMTTKTNPEYSKEDEHGPYRSIVLTGPGIANGDSGRPWKGYDPAQSGRCWSVPKTGKYAEWIEKKFIPGYRSIASIHKRLDLLDECGLILWPKKKGGVPSLKRYLTKDSGTLPGDVWTDINPVSSMAKERTGYPTQKPLALLERIIKASSNQGDMVLDPFCGCATACHAAERLNRQWIGIDVSEKAAQLIQMRINQDIMVSAAGGVIHRDDIPQISGMRTKNIKHVLYGMQEGRCNGCCGHYEFKDFEVDHVIPRAKGGQDIDSNLQLLCGHCNRVKGGKLTMAELKARLKEIGMTAR